MFSEVEEYVEAEEALQEFLSKHAAVMDELHELVQARNDAMQEARMVVRQAAEEQNIGIDCGPIRFKHFTRKVNAEKMYDTLGKEEFSKFGGNIVPSYVADRDTVLRAIDNGEISPEQAEEFYSNIPNYESIEEYKLP